MRIKSLGLFILLAVAASNAARADCSSEFLGGKEPTIESSKAPGKLHDICYTEYDVMYSGATFTAIWSAEHLTKDRISKASNVTRQGNFFADMNVPKDERATPADYTHSGYSRGHMSPSADFSTPQTQNECFSLANMVPQNQNNNGGVWKNIEETVRDLAQNDDDVFVVTGPIFGSNPEKINDREQVPERIFKAIYIPSLKGAAVYVTYNKPGKAWQEISIAELEKLTGIDPFPDLDSDIKSKPMALPDPN